MDRIRQKINEPYFLVAFGGGYDSVLVHRIMVQSGLPFRAFYYKTTDDTTNMVLYINAIYPDVVTVEPNYDPSKWNQEQREKCYCCLDIKIRPLRNHCVVDGLRRNELTPYHIALENEMLRGNKQKLDGGTIQTINCPSHHTCIEGYDVFFAHPIYDWTREEVILACRYLNLDMPDACYHDGKVWCMHCPIREHINVRP